MLPLGLMAIPNLVALSLLSGTVIALTRESPAARKGLLPTEG